MDEEEAARKVLANLHAAARSLRALPGRDRLELAERLDEIAANLEQLTGAKHGGIELAAAEESLVSDTLEILDIFRQIRSPSLRQTIISMVKAAHKQADVPPNG